MNNDDVASSNTDMYRRSNSLHTHVPIDTPLSHRIVSYHIISLLFRSIPFRTGFRALVDWKERAHSGTAQHVTFLFARLCFFFFLFGPAVSSPPLRTTSISTFTRPVRPSGITMHTIHTHRRLDSSTQVTGTQTQRQTGTRDEPNRTEPSSLTADWSRGRRTTRPVFSGLCKCKNYSIPYLGICYCSGGPVRPVRRRKSPLAE